MQDQQKSLEQVMKSAKTKIMQASMLPAIDQLRLEILERETEIQHNQAVYDDLDQEMRTKLEQRIGEVNDGAQILPFADLQSANLVA